jgi:hypothetical protein
VAGKLILATSKLLESAEEVFRLTADVRHGGVTSSAAW